MNVFDTFVNNVYGAGNAIEFFDSNFTVVGGAEDISVDSIFGSCGCSAKEDVETKQIEAGSVKPKKKSTKPIDSMEDLITEYKPEAIPDELTEKYEPPKKIEPMRGGVSASEVADLLDYYR